MSDQLSPANVTVIQKIMPGYACPPTPGSAESRRYTFDANSAGLPLTATDIAPMDYCQTTGISGKHMLHANISGDQDRYVVAYQTGHGAAPQ